MSLESPQKCDDCAHFDAGWSPSWENKLKDCYRGKYGDLRTKEDWTPLQAIRKAGLNDIADLLKAKKVESCFEQVSFSVVSIEEIINRLT